MSRQLDDHELASANGGLQYSISAQKSALAGALGGGLQESGQGHREEEQQLPGDWHDIIKL